MSRPLGNVYDRHHGPYQLQVARRPMSGERRSFSVTTLPGTADADTVEEEALALLADSRDTIVAVFVWSVREQQHVMTYRRKRMRKEEKEKL